MAAHMLDGFEKAIQAEVRARINVIVDEEIAAAQELVRDRMRKEIASLAMKVSNWYEIRTQENRVVIEVKTKFDNHD